MLFQKKEWDSTQLPAENLLVSTRRVLRETLAVLIRESFEICDNTTAH